MNLPPWWIVAALALCGAGCGEPDVVREVPMSDLSMREDSRYYHTGEQVPFSGVGVAIKEGKVISRSQIQGGYRQGEFEVFWPETGKRRSLCAFHNGFRHGILTEWNEEGVKLSESTYNEGALEGPSRTWYVSGALREEGSFAKGKRAGLWTSYYEASDNSRKSEEITYKLGKVDGEKRQWSPNGQLIFQGTYAGDRMEGRQEYWHPNGERMESSFFKGGLAFGRHEGWYDNGQQEFRIYYGENGSPREENRWDRDGNEMVGAPLEIEGAPLSAPPAN